MISRLFAGIVFLVCVVASMADAAILHGPVINPANGRAYYLLEADTWQGSAAQANALGGHLVVINDQAENDWVVSTFSRLGGVPRNLWVGLSDAAKEGTFEWMTREPLTYTGWKAGEPDNSQTGENYAFIHASEQEGQPGAATWGDTLNAGDGGQIAFHGVVEAEHLENDDLFSWSKGKVGFVQVDPWAIGWGSTLGQNNALYDGMFTPYALEDGTIVWRGKSSGVPTARINFSEVPAGTAPLQPHEIIFEPGADGEVVQALWEAPITGDYIVKAAFTDISTSGDGQDVHVSVIGVEVFSSTINAAVGNPRTSYISPTPVRINKGQMVVISVGKGGADSGAGGDSTRIDASICYANASLTQYPGNSSRTYLDSAGNLALTVGNDNLTYSPSGNLLSREAVPPPANSKPDYVQVGDGKISKYRGTDDQLLWTTALDPEYTSRGVGWTRLDAEGNVLIIGTHDAPPWDINHGTSISLQHTVEKYAAEDGRFLWRKTLGTLFKGSIQGLKIDSKGNVVVVALSTYTMMHIWKISTTDGHLIWGDLFYNTFAREVTFRSSGTYSLRCVFDDFDNPMIVGEVNRRYQVPEYDIYAAKYEANTGVKQWEKLWRAPSSNYVQGALVDKQGDVVLVQSGSFIRYKALLIDDQYVTFPSHTEAMLHARIRVSDSQATMYVEYGTDASYGMRTPEVPVPADGLATVRVGELTMPNTYHYRIVVETSDAVALGESRNFTMAAAPNQKPVAQPDTYVNPVPTPVEFVIDVLTNDSDPDGDPIRIVGVSQGKYGTVSTDGSNALYKPNPGFVADTFSYTIRDSYGASSTATVTVTKNPERPPVAVDDIMLWSLANSEVNVLSNDYDPEGKTLTLMSVTQPGNGTVSVLAGGRVQYTPNPGFRGEDQFTYVVSDGIFTAQATVRVNVAPNLPPVAVDDTAQSVVNGIAINVLANDSDPEGKPLTIRNIVQPTNGSVDNHSGQLYYRPHPRFVGTDQFTYTVSDGVLSDSATVMVTVKADGDYESLTTAVFRSGPRSGGPRFYRFGMPSINDRGDIAVRASFSDHLNTDGEVISGLFVREGGSSLRWLTREGRAAPDSEGIHIPKRDIFRSFKDPLLNERGDVAFLAKISSVAGKRISGIWLKPAEGILRMVVREGDPAPGVNEVRLGTILSLGLADSGAIPFIAKLQVGKGGVTSKDSLGVWMATEAGTQLLLRQGDILEVGGISKQVKTFATLTTPSSSPGHERLEAGEELLVRVTWVDKTHSILRVSPSTAPQVLVSSGDEAPGTGARFASFGLPSPDRDGGFAISASLQGKGVTSTNDVCVYSCTSEGNWELLARESETEALKLERSQPVRNAEGRTAFLLTNRTTGEEEIWSTQEGLVFKEAEEQPSRQPLSIVSLAYPDGEYGGAVYLARRTSRTSAKKAQASKMGLWAIDNTGKHHLLCEIGREFSLYDPKRIRAIDTLRTVPGSAAQPRSYNSKGQIVYRLTFNDGSQAIVQRQLP